MLDDFSKKESDHSIDSLKTTKQQTGKEGTWSDTRFTWGVWSELAEPS